MATNDLKDIEGFILREIKYKESSKIIEVFTKELGRISVMARGVYRKKNPNLAITNRFSKVKLDLYKSKGDFYGIKEGNLENAYKNSHKDFEKIVFKSAIADLLLKTIDQNQKNLVYKLLDQTFLAFENLDGSSLNIYLSFMVKYLAFSGYKPNFSHCPYCNKKSEMSYFSIKEGSLICDNDIKNVKDKIYLTREEIKYFMQLLYTPSKNLEEVKKPLEYKKIGRLIINLCLDKLEISSFNSLNWVLKDLSERK